MARLPFLLNRADGERCSRWLGKKKAWEVIFDSGDAGPLGIPTSSLFFFSLPRSIQMDSGHGGPTTYCSAQSLGRGVLAGWVERTKGQSYKTKTASGKGPKLCKPGLRNHTRIRPDHPLLGPMCRRGAYLGSQGTRKKDCVDKGIHCKATRFGRAGKCSEAKLSAHTGGKEEGLACYKRACSTGGN